MFPKARVFPLARVVKAVEIKVPQRQTRGRVVGLHHGVGGAFDAPLHPQRTQQVPHQRGFARAQVTMQQHQHIGAVRLLAPQCTQALGKRFGRCLITPSEGFYNHA